MNKKLLITILALTTGFSQAALAGGLYTNTNQSATFARFMALDASTGTDAVYYNPAGLAMLSEGWHFYLTNQSAFQTRTINNSLATLNHNDYHGVANAPFLPSFQLAWRTGSWAFSAGFGVIGGGGKAEFNQGLPSFEASISGLPSSISALGVPTTAYNADIFLNGSSLYYGGQLGATYKINDMFAVFGGARVVYAVNGYDGYIRNIAVNPIFPPMFTGNMVSAPGFFTAAAQYFTAIGQPAKAAIATQAASDTQDKVVDVTQSGWGVTPIIGANFNWENLNIGVKYEFITKIDITNHVNTDNTGMFPDGEKNHSDIPALLTVGASYRFFEKKLQVALGYHHFFDNDAQFEKDKQQYIDHGINEYLWGIEWDAHRYFLVSAGGQFTRTGVEPQFQSDTYQSFNSYSLGFGGAVKLNNDKIRINVGYFFTSYEQAAKETHYNRGVQTETYNRTNNVLAVGIDLKF